MAHTCEAWPKDTETKKYLCIPDGLQLDALDDLIQITWPGVSRCDILISVEDIHINHLNYDLHDESDWATFLIIEHKPMN